MEHRRIPVFNGTVGVVIQLLTASRYGTIFYAHAARFVHVYMRAGAVLVRARCDDVTIAETRSNVTMEIRNLTTVEVK